MESIERPTQEVTQEWLDLISDDEGLTNGQRELLGIWCGGEPIGKEIPVDVAIFMEKCKGYRKMPENIRGFLRQ